MWIWGRGWSGLRQRSQILLNKDVDVLVGQLDQGLDSLVTAHSHSMPPQRNSTYCQHSILPMAAHSKRRNVIAYGHSTRARRTDTAHGAQHGPGSLVSGPRAQRTGTAHRSQNDTIAPRHRQHPGTAHRHSTDLDLLVRVLEVGHRALGAPEQRRREDPEGKKRKKVTHS